MRSTAWQGKQENKWPAGKHYDRVAGSKIKLGGEGEWLKEGNYANFTLLSFILFYNVIHI